MNRDIFIYNSYESWNAEQPDATLRGVVLSQNHGIIEIRDEQGFTQLINLSRLYAVCYA